MEKTLIPEKASSFSGRDEKKVCEPSRNLSLPYTKPDNRHADVGKKTKKKDKAPTIEEESDVLTEDDEDRRDLAAVLAQIDRFLELVEAAGGEETPPEVPRSAVNELAVAVEEVVLRLEAEERRQSPLSCHVDMGEFSLLDAIGRVAGLAAALGAINSEAAVASRTSAVLQRAMNFLEEEFRSLLEDNKSSIQNPHTKETDEGATPTDNDPSAEAKEIYPAGTVERLRRIAASMISAGYETECCQAFSIARRGAMTAGMAELGFNKAAAEEVERMPWQRQEGEISTWIAAFRRAVIVAFPRERHLCEAVFARQPAVSAGLFSNLARGVIIQLLNFAEAVTATQPSGEKLFKFLDMYEAMRDLTPVIIALFPAKDGGVEEEEEEEEGQDSSVPSSLLQAELKSELTAAKLRIGDAVVGVFSNLENSIKSETGRTPVPGGDIHPLTRYVMNYLEYACEYRTTLEQIYGQESQNSGGNIAATTTASPTCTNEEAEHTPFARQLIAIMDFLEGNLDEKSKLYKDPSLSSVFLMNNGRYIVQKLKGWTEMNEMLGAAWYRKRSSGLRQHHKNYQRETWGKVLGCLRDEGLQRQQHQRGGGAAVSKAALKERFKSFNAVFDEIHKTQSGWVVRDEQLQSELRVSVSAVVVPAYRSFLGRYRQHLEGGKQSDRYIKYSPEELESCIDELFDPKGKS